MLLPVFPIRSPISLAVKPSIEALQCGIKTFRICWRIALLETSGLVSRARLDSSLVMVEPSRDAAVLNWSIVSVQSATVFKPALTFSKTSTIISDPVNGTINPKYIPGAIAEYRLTATSPSSYSVTSNSILITDPTPPQLALVVADIGGPGSGPAAFTPASSSLTYAFISLPSAADNIDFSNNGGATWTYAPIADANGVDTAVTNLRLRPQGAMAASSTFNFRVRYRIK